MSTSTMSSWALKSRPGEWDGSFGGSGVHVPGYIIQSGLRPISVLVFG